MLKLMFYNIYSLYGFYLDYKKGVNTLNFIFFLFHAFIYTHSVPLCIRLFVTCDLISAGKKHAFKFFINK